MQGEQLQQGEIRTSGAMACQGITGFGVFSQLSSLRLQQSQFETRATLKRHCPKGVGSSKFRVRPTRASPALKARGGGTARVSDQHVGGGCSSGQGEEGRFELLCARAHRGRRCLLRRLHPAHDQAQCRKQAGGGHLPRRRPAAVVAGAPTSRTLASASVGSPIAAAAVATVATVAATAASVTSDARVLDGRRAGPGHC